jgi:pimeloyl-ACP methyl ester carboxylesterase
MVIAERTGERQEVRPGRALHVVTHDAGTGTTLFFLHGSGGNVEQWRFQWRHFHDRSVNLVGWDALGHGGSPQPRAPQLYAGSELIADARALFARYRTARNIVIAHSMGVRVTLACLLEESAGVDAAVLIGPPPLGTPANARRALFGGWLGALPLPLLELARPWLSREFRRRAWHPDADAELVRTEQRATRRNRLFMMQALLEGAPAIDAQRLAQLTLPVRILAGENDGLVPVAAARELAGALPRAALTVLPRCGHQIMLERPAETNAAIEEAIA